MADIKMTLGTINRGAVERRFQTALAAIGETMTDPDLKGKPREITIVIKLTPDDEEFVKVESTVKLKTPVTTDVGTGWVQKTDEDSSFATKEFGLDPRQQELSAEVIDFSRGRRGRDDN